MERNSEMGMHNPDRNAFLNHFRSPHEFRSIIFNKLRHGGIELDKIKNNKLKFVGELIGRDASKKLSPGEINIFIDETEKIVLESKRMIEGARKKAEEDALAAGFVAEVFYDKNGKQIPRGDAEAHQAYMDDEGEDAE